MGCGRRCPAPAHADPAVVPLTADPCPEGPCSINSRTAASDMPRPYRWRSSVQARTARRAPAWPTAASPRRSNHETVHVRRLCPLRRGDTRDVVRRRQPGRPREPASPAPPTGCSRTTRTSRPGTDGWRREKAIEGYCSHASIRPGETLTVFVSTDPAARFTIDFYRMGYYGGKGGRHVLSVGPLDGEPQPTPADGPKALIECRWKPGLTLEIPDDWVSGVYLGKLTAAGLEGRELRHLHRPRRPQGRPAVPVLRPDLAVVQPLAGLAVAVRLRRRTSGTPARATTSGSTARTRSTTTACPPTPSRSPTARASSCSGSSRSPSGWRRRATTSPTSRTSTRTPTPKGLLRGKGFLSVGHDEYWTRADVRQRVPGPRRGA